MTRHPWMPLYVGDYLADTRHLSTIEHGAYLLLIMHYWRTGGLPADETQLARIAGLDADQWSDIRPTLAALFDPHWKHKRIEFELTEAARLVEASRRGGIASGRTRRQKRERNEGPSSTFRQQDQNVASSESRTNANEREPLQSHSTDSPIGESGAAAPPTQPVYADSVHELWGEGVPILQQLGVPERTARSMIGRWLRDARDDAQHVLGAIQRARDRRVADPIPWITRAIQKGNRDATARKVSPLIAAVDRHIERFAGEIPDGEMGEDPPRLLPDGRRGRS